MERKKLLNLLYGESISRSLYVIAKLEIANHLLDGPKSIYELAKLSQCNLESLYRILKMLVGFGVFEEQPSQIFTNNEMSSLLSKDSPKSLYHLTLFYGEDIHESLNQLLESARTGENAFELVFKQAPFNYYREYPDRASLFQNAMKEKAAAIIKSALCFYDFGRFNSIYDIGGGHGNFMKAILEKYPHINGGIFDLPEVITTLKSDYQKFIGDRCQLFSGDFFAAIPTGADAYLFKSIFHDWNDVQAKQILKNCHQAMGPNGRLILVEIVLLPEDKSMYANCMDILMLAATGGKERSLENFKSVLDRAGFALENIYPTDTEFSILEARKK